MRFFALISLHGEPPREILTPELIHQEIDRIKELMRSGICRDAWRRTDKVGIILLISASSESACRELLASLPFALAGVLEVEQVIPVHSYLEVYGLAATTRRTPGRAGRVYIRPTTPGDLGPEQPLPAEQDAILPEKS
jgi:muconolactone delta-isomerase